MGQGEYGAALSASVSSSATQGFENQSSISNNAPDYAMWIIVGLAVILGGVWFLVRR